MKEQEVSDVVRYIPKAKDGLTSHDVEIRRASGLVNDIKSKTSKTYLKIIVENTFTFFSCVLFAIAIFLGLCDFGIIPGVGYDANGVFTIPFGPTKFLFLVPLIINIVIGIVQQCRSKRVLEKLSIVNKQKYTVIRNKIENQLDTEDIVADDIIYLKTGQQIPADMEIISGTVEVNESLLTGESEDVKKTSGEKLYSGSFITSGSCTAYTDKVGKDTYIMKIQSKVKEITKNKSQLMKNIYSIIKVMTFVLFALVGISIINMIINHVDPTSIIETVSAVAIGCIPTGLVLITSITLSVSVVNLAKKKVLIQELYSLENLSRIDTICFDKTGTLTDGTMKVEEVNIIDRKADFKGYIGTFLGALTDHNQTIIALLKKFNVNTKYSVKGIENFTSARKCSTVILKNNIELKLGAPEYLLSGDDLNYMETVDKKAALGYRVLAFTQDDQLIALLCLTDNVRESSIKTIKYFNENGVDVKIISGDNPLTVANIAKRCGVENADKCINMQHVSLDEIPGIVDDFTVFGRINPEQKEAVVKALQAKGHKVGMTGDGINDTLALKAADASITFQTATDAAKGISDVVLMNDSFEHITDVVGQGRRVVNNIQRSAVLFLSKTFLIIFMVLFAVLQIYDLQSLNIENLFIMESAVIAVSGFLLSIENTKKPITSGFKKTVYPKAITSGLLMAIAALTAYQVVANDSSLVLPNQYVTINDMAGALMTTLVTIGSLFVLIMVCMPLTPYKVFVISLATGLSILMALAYPNIFLLANGTKQNIGIFEQIMTPFDFSLTFNCFTKSMWISVITYTFAAIPAYIALMAGIQYLLNKSYAAKLLRKYIEDKED